MSKKEKNTKNSSQSKKKSIQESDSGSKTYIDSLFNSNLKEKENLNFNIYQKFLTEIYDRKLNKEKTNINNQKAKNFYSALRTLNLEKSQNFNSSKKSCNLTSNISEFSEMNPDVSKNYNVSKYLHHPIVKQIIKIGNKIIKKQNCNEYKVNNGFEINKPLVSVYNMKNIFEKFDLSYIGEESSATNSKIKQNETINVNDIINHRTKKIKYFHRKNKSSITNYYFNDNNKKKLFFHLKDNISSLIEGQNKIIFKDKDSATTITKEDYNNKDIHIHELNDINININIFNNNKDLEVINDFDETKENKVYSTNKKKDEFSKENANNNGLNIKNIFGNNQNKMKTINKNYNFSINKTLRKKYERTDFISRNFKNNNLELMNNLMNKFEQCYQNNKKNKTTENDLNIKIQDNSDNKNNETFIVNNVENNLRLNIDVSENSNNSYNKNNNEISLSKTSDINLSKSIKSELQLSNKNSKEDNSLNVKKVNLNKNNFDSPELSNRNNHHFNISSPFKKNIDENSINQFLETNKINKKDIINFDEENQIRTVFDYTFYQKLLDVEQDMIKRYKFILKNELTINTELRLEILLWMMKICEEFAFKRDTYHNACYYFDMFLCSILSKNQKKNEINIKDKSELELIGLTCIVISAKLEEIQLPRLKEYAELLSNKYNANSLIKMEKKICSELRWKLIVVTKNTWLSWYICQWDLFIETFDDIKSELLKLFSEDDILYYKRPNDNSYMNFRKICQLIDIMALDFHSYNYEPRILIASAFFIILCNKYNLKYNFNKKKFDNNSKINKVLLDIYSKFISQSFDFDFKDNILQKVIKYFYTNYIDFEFTFDLPLFYQVNPNRMDIDSFEDFLSYQTTNDNFFKTIKDKISINKNDSKKRKNFKEKNKFSISNIIMQK